VAPSTRVTVPWASLDTYADVPAWTTASASPCLDPGTGTEPTTCSEAPSISVTRPCGTDASHAPPPDSSTRDDWKPSPRAITPSIAAKTTVAATAAPTRRAVSRGRVPWSLADRLPLMCLLPARGLRVAGAGHHAAG
jgi:hypothetical protein